PSDFHLDTRQAAREETFRLLQQLGQRLGKVDARAVGWNFAGRCSEKGMQRLSFAQTAQVPQRDVDGGDGKRRRAAASDVEQPPPHQVPKTRNIARVAPCYERREVVLD